MGGAVPPPARPTPWSSVEAVVMAAAPLGKNARAEGQALLMNNAERGAGGGGGATSSDPPADAAEETATASTSAMSSAGWMGRARFVATATLVTTAVLALAAVAVPWGPGGVGGMGGGPFATLGSAGYRLGTGVRQGGGRRAGSETTTPKAPGTLASFNPFTDSRGLKLTPRKLPPLTPAGLAKSQKATMIIDQVGAQWLMSSAAAAEEDREENRKRDDEADEAYDDEQDVAHEEAESERGGGGGGGGSDDSISSRRVGSRQRGQRGGGGGGGADRNKRARSRRRHRDFVEPMMGDVEPASVKERQRRRDDGVAQPEAAGARGRDDRSGSGGSGSGRSFRRRGDSDAEDTARLDDGDYGDERSSSAARGGGGDAAAAAASPAAWMAVLRHVLNQSGGKKNRGAGGAGRLDDDGASTAQLGRGTQGDYAEDDEEDALDTIDDIIEPEDEVGGRGGGGGGGRGSAKGMSPADAARLGKSPRPCILKRTATDKQAQAVLDYVCNPVHGMPCAPISKGGKAYYPNTKRDHAAWAIHQFFKRRSQEPDAFPQQDCHFVGVASLNIPGNFYLTAGGALTRANHHTDVITRKVRVPPEGMYFKTQEDIVGELTGQADAFDPLHSSSTPSTAFKFWAGAAAGTSGCTVEATVMYDFDGDNRPDRTETFEVQGVPEEPNLIPVETKVLGHSLKARGDKFWSAVTNAKVQLFVKSPDCPGEVNVWESAAMYPSFLTVPYRAPLGN